MSEADILKIICSYGGRIDYEILLGLVSCFPDINYPEFDSLFENEELFFLTETNGVKQILAKTNIRLCQQQMTNDCTGCSNLHFCKFHLLGDCKNRLCRFGHDLTSDHNKKVLSDHQLQKLEREELRQLLLQNDSPHRLLPPVCAKYNQGGNGEFGKCNDKDNCRRVHVCEDYIRGTCNSRGCGRSHDFSDAQPKRSLWGKQVPVEMVKSMSSIYQKIMLIRSTLAKDFNPKYDAKPEKNEICLSFVRYRCKNGERCWRVHTKMPYLWQVNIGETWNNLPHSEDIERYFCNPSNTTALSERSEAVCFDTMTSGSHKVRRLSTASSVVLPDFILTTEWLWYWEDQYGKWIPYDSPTEKHSMSSISSSQLEMSYQKNNKAFTFTVGEDLYELSFKDMVQKDMRYGTQIPVRRRPNFISSGGVQAAKTSPRRSENISAAAGRSRGGKELHPSQHGRDVPGHWDKSAVPETGCKRVALQSTDQNYLVVQELFRKTLSGFTIDSIERIQNKKLWDDFQTKQERMEKVNKKYGAGERVLFHSTDSKFIESICNQNFDWREYGYSGQLEKGATLPGMPATPFSTPLTMACASCLCAVYSLAATPNITINHPSGMEGTFSTTAV
ncbi:protein mono-ADP-ribosyltransferase PARP12-like [Sardina pilchardus]|uniref:protein mono-ADP-ribosyltransferase PARP12-like n=1 Tax=Sardina pilchardus TaxID=27697 RepID=UPI002E162ABC